MDNEIMDGDWKIGIPYLYNGEWFRFDSKHESNDNFISFLQRVVVCLDKNDKSIPTSLFDGDGK